MQSFLDLHYPLDVDWAEVHGMRIAYADVGAGGVPIVLVHGLSGYIPMCRRTSERWRGTGG